MEAGSRGVLKATKKNRGWMLRVCGETAIRGEGQISFLLSVEKKKISPCTRRHESIGGKRSQSQTILQVLRVDRCSCILSEEQEEALSSQPAPGPISEEP